MNEGGYIQQDLFGEAHRVMLRPEKPDKADYNAFVDKFKKHRMNTDDCYTPPAIYEAVLEWVRKAVPLDADAEILRPFRPGGDYLAETYTPRTVVVDNPPFSIFTAICRNYLRMGVRFFLFAQHVTCFSADLPVTRVIPDVRIVYENGAVLNTAFVSNMFGDVAAMTAPELRRALKRAARIDGAATQRQYVYPEELLTSGRLGAIHDVPFHISRRESCFCKRLDAQTGGVFTETASSCRGARPRSTGRRWSGSARYGIRRWRHARSASRTGRGRLSTIWNKASCISHGNKSIS